MHDTTAIIRHASPRSAPRPSLGGAWLYLLVGVPLAVVWLAVLIAFWVTIAVTFVTPLGPLLLVLFAHVCARACALEAALARGLLGSDTRVAAPRSAHGLWRRAGAVLGYGEFWRQQRFLVLRVFAFLPYGLFASLALPAAAILCITAPAHVTWSHTLEFGVWTYQHPSQGARWIPVGVVLAVFVWPVLRFGGWAAGHTVRAMSSAPDSALLAPVPVPRLWRGATVHALANATVIAILVVIWALTPAAPFWPIWALLPLLLTASIHAFVVAVVAHGRSARWSGGQLGIAIHAGVAALLELFLIGVWATASVHVREPFWPVWTLIGLSPPIVVHMLVRYALGAPRGLEARVDELAQTRAAVVDAHSSELRRIERDLHDGAQARIVALGMVIGRAEQQIDTDPARARELLGEAREDAKTALEELRQLARGIAPPVLVDRGLAAAVRSLADTTPTPPELVIGPLEPGDVPTAIETAAYFVVAEALANAAKHAADAQVRIVIERSVVRGSLVVEVRDDGPGGADATGSGLDGLRRRVEALDGALTVSSPLGGPTSISAELPCGS